MSRIFDALQRAESERSGPDSSTLPQGTDLLRHAEQRAASRWESKTSFAEVSANGNGSPHIAEQPEIGAQDRPDETGLLSPEERLAVLDSFGDLPMSIPSDGRLVCVTDRESPTAEAVRLLAVRLRDLRRTHPLKKVLITSTIPQEGKSTISANLACALGNTSEEKILLVEGDVRLPTLLPMFGTDKVPGLLDSLHEEAGPIGNIYRLGGAGIWILPAGSVTGNPLESLQSERLPECFNRLNAIFDWIIIDSPPVLPLADTSIWMRLADGVLLVTRQGVTQRKQLKKGLEALEPEKLLGAIMNGTVPSAYSSYYYRTPHNL